MAEGGSPIEHLRDRIVEFRRMKAAELRPHPLNPRRHPLRQHGAVKAFLARIGIADRLLARQLPNGQVELLDGHLRAEDNPSTTWPVLITDLNDAEAKEFILMLHKLAGLAEDDPEHLATLLDEVSFEEDDLATILDELRLGTDTVDDWNTSHDYDLKKAHDRSFVKLVIALHHHSVIEQVLAEAMEAFDCDRGEAFKRICELAQPHIP